MREPEVIAASPQQYWVKAIPIKSSLTKGWGKTWFTVQ